MIKMESRRAMVIFFLSKQWQDLHIGKVISEFRSTFRYPFYKSCGHGPHPYQPDIEGRSDKVILRNVHCADIKSFCEIKILPINQPLRLLKFSLEDYPWLLEANTYEGCTLEHFMLFIDKIYERATTYKGLNTSMIVVNWEVTDIDMEKYNHLCQNYIKGKEFIDYYLEPETEYVKIRKQWPFKLVPGGISWKNYLDQKI